MAYEEEDEDAGGEGTHQWQMCSQQPCGNDQCDQLEAERCDTHSTPSQSSVHASVYTTQATH